MSEIKAFIIKLTIICLAIFFSIVGITYWLSSQGIVSKDSIAKVAEAVAVVTVTLGTLAGAVAAAAGVVTTVVDILKSLPITVKKHTQQKITITSTFLKDKSKTNTLIILFYITAILAFIYYQKDLYAILSTIMLVFFIIHQQLLTYRINKGYYANNAYETLELIEFIVANSKDIDFSDGDNQKHLFPEKATQTVNDVVIKGVKA